MDWTSTRPDAFRDTSHRPDEDVIEELAQHAGAMYAAARADGCTPEEADRRVTDHLERWRLDAGALRHRSQRAPVVVAAAGCQRPPAWPAWRRTSATPRVFCAAQPRHALLTILTMALGIGATTVLFSVTYGVLMKPLPWPNADRIVVLKETRGGNVPRFGDFTNAAYLAWREDAATLEHIAAWSQRSVTLSGTGEPERIRIIDATASLFPVLGARPLVGSFFEPRDETSRGRRALGAPVAAALRRRSRPCSAGPCNSMASPTPLSACCRTAWPIRIGRRRAVVPYAVRPATGNYAVDVQRDRGAASGRHAPRRPPQKARRGAAPSRTPA